VGTQTLVGLDGQTGQVKWRVSSAGQRHTQVRNREGSLCTPGAVIDYGVSSEGCSIAWWASTARRTW